MEYLPSDFISRFQCLWHVWKQCWTLFPGSPFSIFIVLLEMPSSDKWDPLQMIFRWFRLWFSLCHNPENHIFKKILHNQNAYSHKTNWWLAHMLAIGLRILGSPSLWSFIVYIYICGLMSKLPDYKHPNTAGNIKVTWVTH